MQRRQRQAQDLKATAGALMNLDLNLIDAQLDHVRAAMTHVVADAVSEQLSNLFLRHVQLAEEVQENAAGHWTQLGNSGIQHGVLHLIQR
eukprot:Skav210999  [mRNA]  locus=scaffold4415:4854:5475:- [translate_table: standard]